MPPYTLSPATLQKIRWHIGLVETWIQNQGWKIRIKKPKTADHGFYCNYHKKTIETNPTVSPPVYLYSLLHECGHLFFHDPDKKADQAVKNPRFVSRNLTQDKFSGNSKSVALTQFDEELDAWAHGEALAAHLGIKLDTTRYQLHKTQCLVTHARTLSKKLFPSQPTQPKPVQESIPT